MTPDSRFIKFLNSGYGISLAIVFVIALAVGLFILKAVITAYIYKKVLLQ